MRDQREREEQTLDIVVAVLLFGAVLLLGGVVILGGALLGLDETTDVPDPWPQVLAGGLVGCGSAVAFAYLHRRRRR